MDDLTISEFEIRVGLVTDPDDIDALGLEADEESGAFETRRLRELQEFCHNNTSYHIVTFLDNDSYVNEVTIADSVSYFLAAGSREPLTGYPD